MKSSAVEQGSPFFGHQLVHRSSTAGRSIAAATFISMPTAKKSTTVWNGRPVSRSTSSHSFLNPALVAARISGSWHAA